MKLISPRRNQSGLLRMTACADSLKGTCDVLTAQQKPIINRELRDVVLEVTKYPEITLKSTDVTGNVAGGQYQVRISGDLSRQDVTRHIVIPAQANLPGNTLRARGEF